MATIKGVIETEIFTTDDGFVAIQQLDGNNGMTGVLLSADQLPTVIDLLQECHARRSQWQEPTRG